MLTSLIQAQGSRGSIGIDALGANSYSPLLWEELVGGQGINLLTPPDLALENSNTPIPDNRGTDVQQSLVSLLPSQEDANSIVANTTAWLWGLRCPPGSVLRPNEPIPDLDIAEISKSSTMDIAKALLYLAIYMQQLPPGFDTQCLEVQSIEATIERYVGTVNSLVLAKEELVCSGDGLECLHLLGTIYINEGALRKAWLSFRRALDVAKLKGFRDSYTCSSGQGQSDELATTRRMWLDSIAGDCYCSLLLGLEPVLGSQPFGPDNDSWNDLLEDTDATFERKFYPIVARLAQQNFLGSQHDYESTQAIDQDLDQLWDSMPIAWQKSPTLRPGRSIEAAQDYGRLMCHLWFFQIRMFVHLPAAFSNPESGDLGFSRDRCLEASRIILHWYLGIQQEGKGHPRCNVIGITAFLAAVTILLAEFDQRPPGAVASPRKRAYSSDTALLEQFVHSLEALTQSCDREHIARQSARILSTMLAISKELGGLVLSDTSSSEPAFDTVALRELDNPKTAAASGDTMDMPPPSTVHGSSGKQDRPGLEDILASSFQKALGIHSLAARVLNVTLSARR
jgi:hypothetical protein